MKHDEWYEVRHREAERALRSLAVVLEGHVPEDWAWGVFLVKFGDNGAAAPGVSRDESGAVFWMSNAERAGMIEAVKGWIADQERRGGG